MILPEQFVTTLRADAQRKARNKKKRCFVSGCDKYAIQSHVLWKKGILNTIQHQRHLCELNTRKRIRGEELDFTLTGINEILSFKGFCNFHDTQIFKYIETKGVDFNIYRNQILVSVRGLYHEIRKKEENIDWYREIIKEKILPFDEQLLLLQHQIQMHELGIRDISFYTTELSLEYRKPIGRFYFSTFKLPFVPFVASSMFHTDSFETMEYMAENDPNHFNTPLNSLLFSFFPYEGHSILIIGFHTNYLQNMDKIVKLKNMNEVELFQFISDVLLERIESWACSPIYFDKYLKKDKEVIIDYFNEDPTDFSTLSQKKFNLFGSWYAETFP